MYINDKYVVDVIMSVIMTSNKVIETPQDYEYEYEDMHGIRLSELRSILNDMLGGKTNENNI